MGVTQYVHKVSVHAIHTSGACVILGLQSDFTEIHVIIRIRGPVKSVIAVESQDLVHPRMLWGPAEVRHWGAVVVSPLSVGVGALYPVE